MSHVSPFDFAEQSRLVSSFLLFLSTPATQTMSTSLVDTALLSTPAFVSSNLSAAQLGLLLRAIPTSDLRDASSSDLDALYTLLTTPYTLRTWWAPEAWALLAFFVLAGLMKGLVALLLSKGPVNRFREAEMLMEQRRLDHTLAKAGLDRSVKAM